MDIEEDHLIYVPPDGGWGWAIVLAAFFCNFVVDGTMYTFGMFLEPLAKYLNTSIGTITVIGSVNCGSYFLAGPFVSALVNSCGFRVVSFLGGLISAASYVGTSMCTDLTIIILVNGVCAGIGLAMVVSPAIIVVGFYFERWRALATGIATCGSGFGTLTVPLLMHHILEKYGWRTSYRVIGGMMLVTSVLAFTFKPIQPIRVVSAASRMQLTTPKEKKKFRIRKQINRNYPTTYQVIDTKSIMIINEDDNSTESEIITPVRTSSSLNTISKPSLGKSILSRMRYTESSRQRAMQRCRHFFLCLQCKTVQSTTPFYRDDIFYNQSLMLLSKYEKKRFGMNNRAVIPGTSTNKERSLNYNLSVTRTSRMDGSAAPSSFMPFARVFRTMLDTALLKSPTFEVFMLSGLIVVFGYMSPYLYIKERAENAGIDRRFAVWLLSTMGLATTMGRIFNGVLLSVRNTDIIYYSCVTLVVGGLFTAVSGQTIFMNMYGQFVYAVVFGWAQSSVGSLRPLIVVYLFGLEYLTNAFGLQMLFMGVGTLCGMTITGVLVDWLQGYEEVFIISGFTMILSGLLHVVLKRLRKWEKRKGVITSSTAPALQ